MNIEDEWVLKIRPRPSQAITLEIPIDTLNSLKQIAEDRDMSLEALLKFYIGQSLRQDLAKRYADGSQENVASSKD